MKSLLGFLSVLFFVVPKANAQTPDDVQLSVGGYEQAANGPERAAGVSRGTGPITLGISTIGVFSMFGCGYFSVTVPPAGFKEDATTGWSVSVTPTRVVNHAVTFRLGWFRLVNRSRSDTPSSEDVEVTLAPGESRQIDVVPINQAETKTFDGRPCGVKAASLRVSAQFPDMDRRLVSADVWLVQRLGSGKEESQKQSVRGVPHQPLEFYFDRVAVGTSQFDVFGKLVTEPAEGGLAIALESVRSSPNSGDHWGYWAARWFRASLRLKPDETVEVALPAMDPKDSGGSSLSLRIRAKLIR